MAPPAPGPRAHYGWSLNWAFRYEHDDLLPRSPGTKTPEFLALNPNSRLPVIEDDGFVLCESMAINFYLAKKHNSPLYPSDPRNEALALQWSFWEVDRLDRTLANYLTHTSILPEAERDKSHRRRRLGRGRAGDERAQRRAQQIAMACRPGILHCRSERRLRAMAVPGDGPEPLAGNARLVRALLGPAGRQKGPCGAGRLTCNNNLGESEKICSTRSPSPIRSSAMPRGDLFPEIGPYETGYLPLSTSHVMYWEQAGNPRGFPVLFLHGGPGAGAGAVHRRFFDPAFWRIVIFDQRGAGRSRPLGGLEDNTTAVPGRGYRTAAHPSRRRPVSVVRRLLGFDAGAGLRADASASAWRRACCAVSSSAVRPR